MKANEKQIKNLIDILGCTREEAIDTLSFDKGEIGNTEVDKIEEKIVIPTEITTKKKGSSLDKVKNQKAKKKVDEMREKIINLLETSINDSLDTKTQKLTSSKLTFKVNNEFFSVTLTKHKAKPDGYSEE